MKIIVKTVVCTMKKNQEQFLLASVLMDHITLGPGSFWIIKLIFKILVSMMPHK